MGQDRQMVRLNRRCFLQALAASVVAAGAPLPIGFPEKAQRWVYNVDVNYEAVVIDPEGIVELTETEERERTEPC